MTRRSPQTLRLPIAPPRAPERSGSLPAGIHRGDGPGRRRDRPLTGAVARSVLGTLAVAWLLPLGPAGAAPGVTERVSVDSAGNQGNVLSAAAAISASGRFVVFSSDASNLVAGDTNNATDIFVHDRRTGDTTRVSVDSVGNESNAGSFSAAISADGRFVAFISFASNLVPGDTNNASDIFVHDRRTGLTTRVNVDSAGNQVNASSTFDPPAISANGRFVAFSSDASNLVPGDTNDATDVFVHDRRTGLTTRVSVDGAGAEGNSDSGNPTISASGRFVAFASSASNLVPGDTNNAPDVFVHDLRTGLTTGVSVDSAGNQGNEFSVTPAISATGRFVAFASLASNLVPGDTNNNFDVFVHDRRTGLTTRVSLDSAGLNPAISATGRFVAFNSSVSAFVHDRRTGLTTPVSVDSAGNEANAGSADLFSGNPAISATGRVVAFDSNAFNLVFGDTNGTFDVFVHDRGRAGGGHHDAVDDDDEEEEEGD